MRRKAVKDRLFVGQIVDQCEGLRRIGAKIEADRRALPEHLIRRARPFHVERAFAVAQAHYHRG